MNSNLYSSVMTDSKIVDLLHRCYGKRNDATSHSQQAIKQVKFANWVATYKPTTYNVFDHYQFTLAIRNAGKRNIGGHLKFDKSLEMKDQMDAIRRYVGYSNQPHGVQLDAAIRKARAEANREKTNQ